MAAAWLLGLPAQQGRPVGLTGLVVSFAVLVGALVIGGVVLLVLRKMAVGKEGSSSRDQSVEQLRELRDRGLLSQEEFDRARRSALGLPPRQDGTGR